MLCTISSGAFAASFEITAQSIERRPNGTLIATGDVRIHRYPSRKLVRWVARRIDDHIHSWLLLAQSPSGKTITRMLVWQQHHTNWRIVRDAPWHAALPDGDAQAKATIADAVEEWLRTWNRRDLQGHLAWYASTTTPDEFADRRAWEASLAHQLQSPPLETLTAEKAIYRPKEGTVRLEGHIRFRTAQGEGSARHAFARLRDPYAVLIDAHWRLPDGRRIAAQRIVRRDQAHISAEQLVFSSCPPEKESWRVRAGKGKLDLEDKTFSASHARLELGFLPVLWTPYWRQALTRRSGVLIPSFGGGTRTGTRIGLPIYFAPRADWDATFTPEWMSKRGTMLGLELRHAAQWGGFSLTGQTIRDRVQQKRRSRAFGDVRLALSEHWRGNARIDWVSDADVLADFVPARAQRAYTVSEGELRYAGVFGEAFVRARWQQNLAQPLQQAFTLQTLPSLGARIAWPLARRVSLHFEPTLTRFFRKQGSAGIRLYLYPELRWRQSLAGGGLSVEAALRAGRTEWRLKGNQHAHLSAASASLGVRAAFERFYRHARHEITPSIRVQWAWAPEQTNLPLFDASISPIGWGTIAQANRFVGGDRIERARRVVLQLDSRWQTKDHAGNVRTPFSISLAAIRYLHQPITDRRLEAAPPGSYSPLLLQASLSPVAWMSLSYQMRYELRQRFAASETMSVALQGEAVRLSLSRFVVDARYGAPADAVQGEMSFTHGRWRGKASALYERTQRAWTRRELSIGYRHPCWRVVLSGFEFLRPSSAGGRYDRGVRLLLELAGLGSLGG